MRVQKHDGNWYKFNIWPIGLKWKLKVNTNRQNHWEKIVGKFTNAWTRKNYIYPKMWSEW
jgi:hypothetical protein